MVKHRGLTLSKFCSGVPFELFRAYFQQLTSETKPGDWAYLNPDQMMAFIEAPENAQAAGVVLEEFARINDVCASSASHLVRACEEFGLDYDGDAPPQANSMRLFLRHRKAFEYAWSLFLLRAMHPRSSQYFFPAGMLRCNDENTRELEAFLQGHFFQQKKGRDCIVRSFPDRGGIVVLVSRGSYMKTNMLWERGKVAFSMFRPASEDVLVYEPEGQRLTVKTSTNNDRRLYVFGFGQFIAGDQNLGDRALDTPTFSLEPIQKGDFQYGGSGDIRRVYLREAVLQLNALGAPSLEIRSDDIVRTLKEDLTAITLRSGLLKSVKLAFDFHPGTRRRRQPVIIAITPPAYSDVSSKVEADAIDAYLRSQGVKLI